MTTDASRDFRGTATAAEVDNQLASLASSLSLSLKAKYKRTYLPNPGGSPIPGDYVLVGYEPMTGNTSDFAGAVNASMMPAKGGDIMRWLAELDAITIKRADSHATDVMRLKAYTSRLSAYPADVVHSALFDVKPGWKFWPSWAELEAACDKLVAPRQAMLAAATAPIRADERAENPSYSDKPQNAADRARAAEIMEMAGFTSKRIDAVRSRPMARSDAELYGENKEYRPHWTETVAPDSAEMEQLRAARAANPLMAMGMKREY